jgi:amino acid adenylation domain-containing protein
MLRASVLKLDAAEHILLLMTHHVAIDGWSFRVFFSELSALYKAFSGGTPSPLSQLPIQYADYAAWQREWLQGEVLTHQLEYWRSHLAGAPQVLELPTDRPRPSTESHRGAHYSFSIPREVSEGLGAFSRREGTTLYMTLLSGFVVLLSRYSGQQDLLVGTPVANRNRAEIEELIGLFLNTLVLRNDLSGDPTVQELLARVRERCLNAYAHQELPFEMLVEDLRPDRDLSRNPLFQVMLVLQNAPEQPFTLPGLSLTPVEVDRGAALLDLTLWVYETPEGLSGSFEYATDLFDKTTIERMAGHWRALLEAMIADPKRRLSELSLLTEAERHQLVVELNRTGRDYPRQALMQELFEGQARQAPEHTALRFGATALSYGELEGRANRIAQALRSRGVGRGQRVGLCVERGAEMLAAVLGILKAGAAYVPLDPAFPQERLRFMAEDAQLALLVSSSALAGSFGLPRERQLLLDTDAAALAAQSGERLAPDAALDAGPEDAAYVIYTSGSTGKPKGVVVPHRAVVNFLSSMAREPGLSADDVLVAVTTLSFDIAVLELQLPLTLGATVVIASREQAIDGHALKTLLEQTGATVMQATPVTWRLLLEAGWQGGKGFKALVGGEGLPQELAESLIASGIELWNMYGPTETTVWSTCARITDTARGITIGKPIANTTVYILDAHNNLCPIGVPGELCIGGEGVTLGYWNRPELTAERFIPDPFSTPPGARLYRTGDRARWRNDGTLEHLGRLDFQVKIRGYRIELGEIETAIARHAAIREVVAVAREDIPGDQRLVAYLVAENPPADWVDQLRAQLRAALPEYMVPSAFVVLDKLPLTPNAKIDRKALPAPERSASDEAAYVAPCTPTEEILAGIWAEVLKLERVGRDDNFFELGGHSLLAMQVAARVQRALAVEMRLSEFFVAPTIMGLAARIEALPVKAISDKDETPVRASSSRPSGLTGNREEIVL